MSNPNFLSASLDCPAVAGGEESVVIETNQNAQPTHPFNLEDVKRPQQASREELISMMMDMFRNMQDMFQRFQAQTKEVIAMLRSTNTKYQEDPRIHDPGPSTSSALLEAG